MGRLKAIFREPLLHFLVLGAAIFAASAWFGEPDPDEPGQIVVSAQQVEWLASAWQRRWQRPPTKEEIKGLVEDHVIEEILYREALALGLDRDDTVIRRRLRQKMEFLYDDLAATNEATEAELRAFLKANADKFRTESRVTFRHIYLNADRRGGDATLEARRMLAKLDSLSRPAEAEVLGDPFLLPHYFEVASESEVAKNFGAEFARKLIEARPGRWVGPIKSPYGVHLIFVHDRIAGGSPNLTEVQDAVEREWRVERKKDAKKAFYDQMRERYQIRIDWPTSAHQRVDTRK
jgi:hypothetical protein